MTRTQSSFLVLVGALTLAPTPSTAQRWSPDGRWLAYALAAPQRPGGPRFLISGRDGEIRPEAETRYRLWATRVEGDGPRLDSVRLAEGLAPICQPGWNHDGSALAYARLVRSDGDQAAEADSDPPLDRLEVVIQSDPDSGRVVLVHDVGPIAESDGAAFHLRELAWSADGKFLAVPLPGASGLLVVNLETGKPLREILGATGPSWSPAGALLAFGRGGESPGLALFDPLADEVRLLAPGPEQDRLPPAIWVEEGARLLRIVYRPIVAEADRPRRTRPRIEGGEPSPLSFELVPASGGPPSPLRAFALSPFSGFDDSFVLSLTLGADGERLFSASGPEGGQTAIRGESFRSDQVFSRFNPFLPGATLVGLSACPRPGTTWLALRIGPRDHPSPPALCDPDSERLIPIAPDDAARSSWSAAILDRVGGVLAQPAAGMGPTPIEGQTGDRPTPLPAPIDLAEGDLATAYLRRLARFGRALELDGADARPDPAAAEARLVFAYAAGDFRAALPALDALWPAAGSRDDRRRLLGLRAQILMGLDDHEGASAILEGLIADGPPEGVSILEGPDGPLRLADPPGGWSEALSRRLAEFRSGDVAAGVNSPTDFRVFNPDAPTPGLGLDAP